MVLLKASITRWSSFQGRLLDFATLGLDSTSVVGVEPEPIDYYVVLNGAPGVIRTPGLLVRSQTLYPAELRARKGSCLASTRFMNKSGIQFAEFIS